MSPNHDRWFNGPPPDHRQDGERRRSAPRPYEWYDQEPESGHSKQYDTYHRESLTRGHQQWPQYGYGDPEMQQKHHQDYREAKPTNPSNRGKHWQNEEDSGSKGPSRRSAPSSSKNSQPRWHLSKEFQEFARNSRTDTLLLLDDYCRPLSASKELFVFLQSLPSSSQVQNRIKGVITASKNGRWLALVACQDTDVAKALANEIKIHAKDIEAKFVTNQVFSFISQGHKISLSEGLRQRFSEEGVLLDEWSSPATFEPVKTTSGEDKVNNQQLTLPDSVSRDHRKITSANPLSYAKKAASHISRWNAQQEELQRSDATELHAVPELQLPSNDPSNVMQKAEDFNYLDEEKKACLLCQRQFKSLEVLRRHSVESELHKKNLQDEERCLEGRKRKITSTAAAEGIASAPSTGMRKAGFAPLQSVTLDRKDSDNEPSVDSSMEYRDRAAERRIVFGTEAIAKAKAMAKKRPYSSDLIAKTIPESEDARPAKLDETSIGGALLAKMGWSSGKGLGMDGEGRTDPIITHVYTPGAGIGSIGNNKLVPTVEEYSKRQTKFIQGDAAYQRSARMQERYNE
ncbi:hypothetical protein L7F22_052649 [Adiantum nelumboides]|nr:hypothetical protein [Adiantum nelumboides]